ncbi:putative E3 ubiquitin-protein ligase TRIM71-like isoform X2 [Apostichopus japonicus]|uniref:Putative E3 ubiquitin-protein ligase TRIM71-like isoform X2 n=1 Tax=Stichopus japonicus TaxID=307972 RepID=A0A2G8JMF4_STIJA|nr:putative E3 ubiquitin-protein ligase TRIM71-like isoform X2 [Apostichopus japonicus]
MACTNNFGKRVLERPTGIAVSKDGIIYVADCASNTIEVFWHNYSHMHSIEVKGKGILTHLALNQSEDRIIVADEKTSVIKIIDLNRGKIVNFIDTRISQAPATPFGVALDDEDNIYVSVTFDPSKLTKRNETARNVRRKGAVVTYNSDGYFLGTIGEKELINPRGICYINDDYDSPQLLVVEGGDYESQFSCVKVFRL